MVKRAWCQARARTPRGTSQRQRPNGEMSGDHAPASETPPSGWNSKRSIRRRSAVQSEVEEILHKGTTASSESSDHDSDSEVRAFSRRQSGGDANTLGLFPRRSSISGLGTDIQNWKSSSESDESTSFAEEAPNAFRMSGSASKSRNYQICSEYGGEMGALFRFVRIPLATARSHRLISFYST